MLIHERDCKKTFFFFSISDSKDLARYFAKFLTNEKVISTIELLVSVCIWIL